MAGVFSQISHFCISEADFSSQPVSYDPQHSKSGTKATKIYTKLQRGPRLEKGLAPLTLVLITEVRT